VDSAQATAYSCKHTSIIILDMHRNILIINTYYVINLVVKVGGAPRSQRATLQAAMFAIAQMEVLTAGKLAKARQTRASRRHPSELRSF